MASLEHMHLAQYIKDVHSRLRKSSVTLGAQEAWKRHCQQKDMLEKYAQYMQKLATEYWDVNSCKDVSTATSRIKWTVDECHNYFLNKTYENYFEKESIIAKKINIELNPQEQFSMPLKLLDVGSCYNPLKMYNFLDVLAIDLCPANDFVMRCDFLDVIVGERTKIIESVVYELAINSFAVVTFCFILEYIPTSELRIAACKKAYELLKPGGLLVICTPDSKHVGANSKIMKCWRYTLALMGFARIKYEKLSHMHCMCFRKALHKDIAVRWAKLHKEEYMMYSIQIPQDDTFKNVDGSCKVELSINDLLEMPYSGCSDISK